jgi:hypothetical protein
LFLLSPKILPFMRCGKIWWWQTGHRWQYNTAHALCMLDNKGYRHTLRICNAYCFSTATMVSPTSHVLRYTYIVLRFIMLALDRYDWSARGPLCFAIVNKLYARIYNQLRRTYYK